MDIREREVEQYLVERLANTGTLCLKFIPDNMAGMPDRLVLLPEGKVLWVELKTKGGKLSTIQRYRHIQLRNHGHDVKTTWTKAQVDELVASCARE